MTKLNLSLRKKIWILQGVFLLVIAVTLLATFWANVAQKESALVVNIAGRQRMLSQKMMKDVLGIVREKEAADKGRRIVQQLIDTRDHLARTIAAQKGFEFNQHSIGFIPAKAAKEIAERLTAGTAMTLKQTSLKLRNWENAPDQFETRVLNMFEADRSLDEYQEKVTEKDGKQYLIFMKRLIVLEACLKCHGKRENAPAFVRKNYPNDQAYGYQVGDIRGAISIKMPFYGSAADYINSLTDTMSLFDKTLKALIDGGETSTSGQTVVSLKATSTPEIRGKLAEGLSLWNEFRKNIEVILMPALTVDSEDFRKAITSIETTNGELLKKMDAATTLFQAEADKNVAFQEKVLIWIFFLSLAGTVVTFWIVNRSVIKPLEEHGKKLTLSSKGLSGTADSMLTGMQTQTSRVHQSATATEEMSASVVEVAKNAQAADASAKDAASLAEEGMTVVSKTIEGMRNISDTVKESVKCIEGLDSGSRKIGEMVFAIDDIADQTNLLALNAAIEAARAGESGRGFAVVADEVRKLADRTTKATKQISTLIEDIRRETTCVIGTMHTNVAMVAKEAEYANLAGHALKNIVGAVQNVSNLISHIAVASGQQALAADEVAANLTSISAISDETSGGAQNVVNSCHELSGMADELQGMLKGKA